MSRKRVDEMRFFDILGLNDGFVQSRKLRANGRLQASFIDPHGGP
jgi:hypothetical protein